MNDKWKHRFIRLAKEISTWSKDPSTKVGAVLVDSQNRVVSLGYNGFARGVYDHPDRYEDRELKYKIVLHAEENALYSSHTKDFGDCVMVTYPLPPCPLCASRLLQNGIKKILMPRIDTIDLRHAGNSNLSHLLLEEAGAKIETYDLKKYTKK